MRQSILPFVFLLCALNLSQAKLIVKSITQCEIPKNDKYKGFSFEMTYNAEDKTVSGKMITPFDIDDDFNFELTTEVQEDGKWVAGSGDLQGGLCDNLEMIIPDVATALAKALKRDELCPLKAGEYSLENFGITQEEAKLPVIDVEHTMIKVVYKFKEEPVLCYKFEVDDA